MEKTDNAVLFHVAKTIEDNSGFKDYKFPSTAFELVGIDTDKGNTYEAVTSLGVTMKLPKIFEIIFAEIGNTPNLRKFKSIRIKSVDSKNMATIELKTKL